MDDPKTHSSAAVAGAIPAVSIVIAVLNEAENIAPLTDEIFAALDGRWPYEVVYVDDGSTDGTGEAIARLAADGRPWIRQIRHTEACGKSAAMRTGVRAARAAVVATLDGDGQDDPAFLPALVAPLLSGDPRIGLVAAQRVGRQASGFKRMQSRIANRVRAAILRDGTRDTGCGLKAFPRDLYLALPHFDGLHRFLPALVRREGFETAHIDVVNRPRLHGLSKYGFWNRFGVGILDLLGVWWLIRRAKKIPKISDARRNAG